MSVTAYIGLGANLADPVAQIHDAAAALAVLPHTRLLALSSLYVSPPMGEAYQGQPDYTNAVARLETTLTAQDLLQSLLSIERAFGRDRSQPCSARLLDLDVLLYGAEQYAEAELTVPHPRLHQRAFVLVPLAEVAPAGLEIVGRGSLASLLPLVADQALSLHPSARRI